VSDTQDSVGQVTEIPAGVDPIMALEAIESAPPDSQDTQPAEPEAPAPETTEPPEAEWLRPGKFRTAEDALQSYDALESLAGRQAQELGELRRQQSQPQQQMPQIQQQDLTGPYLPAYNHPPQGYTQEQLDQLAYDNPPAAMDYMAKVNAMEMVSQLIPVIAPLREQAEMQGARNAVDSLRRTYGDDAVTRHSPALAQIIQSDPHQFVEGEQIGTQRLAMALESLEYRRLQQGQGQPRDEQGRFAANPEPVHVEPGSSGAPAQAADPQVDPVVAEMRGIGVVTDRFGHVPSGMSRSQAR
jgi:hypothetical protein